MIHPLPDTLALETQQRREALRRSYGLSPLRVRGERRRRKVR